MSKLFPKYNQPSDGISEFMPKGTTRIFAEGHTLRMLAGASHFDYESCKREQSVGIRGYLWGVTFYEDESVPRGAFRYESDALVLGTLTFSHEDEDGVFNPAPEGTPATAVLPVPEVV